MAERTNNIVGINLQTLYARDRDFPSTWWKSGGSIASSRNISRRYHLNQQDLSRQKFNLISTLSLSSCSHFLPLFVSLLARPHIISRAAGFRTLIRHRAQDSPKFSSYSILLEVLHRSPFPGFKRNAPERADAKASSAAAEHFESLYFVYIQISFRSCEASRKNLQLMTCFDKQRWLVVTL